MRVRIGQLEVIVDSIEELDVLVERYGLLHQKSQLELAKEAVKPFLGSQCFPDSLITPDPTTKSRSDPAVATGISCVGWFVNIDGFSHRRGVAVDAMGVNRAIYTATSSCVRDEAKGHIIEHRFLTNEAGQECGAWAYDQGAVNNFRREQDHPPSMSIPNDVKVKFNGPAEEA